MQRKQLKTCQRWGEGQYDWMGKIESAYSIPQTTTQKNEPRQLTHDMD